MSSLPKHTWDLSSSFTGKQFEVSNKRHGGALQVTWEGNDGTSSTVGFEISNDCVNWQPWTGLRTSDNEAVNIKTIDSASDSQIWEVKRWTARYIRLTYVNVDATAGTAKLFVHVNQA